MHLAQNDYAAVMNKLGTCQAAVQALPKQKTAKQRSNVEALAESLAGIVSILSKALKSERGDQKHRNHESRGSTKPKQLTQLEAAIVNYIEGSTSPIPLATLVAGVGEERDAVLTGVAQLTRRKKICTVCTEDKGVVVRRVISNK